MSDTPKVTSRQADDGPPYERVRRMFEESMQRAIQAEIDRIDRSILEGTPTVEPLGIFRRRDE